MNASAAILERADDEARTRVMVLGAGVIGMASAYALASRGCDVTVVEQESHPGRGASFANGAQLSYAYADAMASPGFLRALPGLLMARDSAVRMKPPLDAAFARWGLSFVRNCTARRFERNTSAVLRLALQSRVALHRLLARHEISFGHAGRGKMHLYFDERSVGAAAKVVELKARLGVRQEILTPEEAILREPALSSLKGRLAAAVYSRYDELGNAHQFCQELRRLLASRYRVRFLFRTRVTRILTANGHVTGVETSGQSQVADQVIVCLGVAAGDLLRRAGVRVPLCPVKGYSITLPATASTPAASITDTAQRLVFCRLGDQVRIAGLAEIGAFDTTVDPALVATMVSRAKAVLPHAADYDSVPLAWAGLRAMTPSGRPIIGSTRVKGLYVNIGHGMLGWTLAMGAAERLASWLTASGRLGAR